MVTVDTKATNVLPSFVGMFPSVTVNFLLAVGTLFATVVINRVFKLSVSSE
jgi:hypothetical protein